MEEEKKEKGFTLYLNSAVKENSTKSRSEKKIKMRSSKSSGIECNHLNIHHFLIHCNFFILNYNFKVHKLLPNYTSICNLTT